MKISLCFTSMLHPVASAGAAYSLAVKIKPV
jgi:hypothetical protein